MDELANAFDKDNFTNEDPNEEQEERNRGKSIVRLEDVYEKPFGIVSSRLYDSNPFYYTNMDINRFDTGFYGGVLLTSNTHISVNNNIGRLNGDTVF